MVTGRHPGISGCRRAFEHYGEVEGRNGLPCCAPARARPDKLAPHADFIRERLAQNGELTLDELCIELEGRGVAVHRSNVGRLLHRLGLSHKRPSGPTSIGVPKSGRRASIGPERRKPFFDKALAQLVFIDETSTNTQLIKCTGWSPKGQRYCTYAPFGG